jgi:hypothetical protein
MTATAKNPAEALSATIADFKANPAMRIASVLARTDDGRVVSPTDPDATCFCALGRYAFHRQLPNLEVYDAVDGPLNSPGELGNYSDSYIYSRNDADHSADGSRIIPILEQILADLTAQHAAAA